MSSQEASTQKKKHSKRQPKSVEENICNHASDRGKYPQYVRCLRNSTTTQQEKLRNGLRIRTGILQIVSMLGKDILVHSWSECKIAQPLWKTVYRFLRNLKVQVAQPFHPWKVNEIKSTYECIICVPMFQLFNSKQLRYGINPDVHQVIIFG